MRSSKEIEEFVRLGNPDIKTGEQMDKQTLNDSYAAMEETIASTSKDYITGMSGFFVRKRAAKLLAAAAAIILVTGLFLGRDGRKPEIPAAGSKDVTQSETKLISMMSMRLSYQQGGFEALDRQFRDTLDVLGPRSSSISMRDLIEGTNGS